MRSHGLRVSFKNIERHNMDISLLELNTGISTELAQSTFFERPSTDFHMKDDFLIISRDLFSISP